MKLKKWLAAILCAVFMVSTFLPVSHADTYTKTLNGKYAQSDARSMLSLINGFRTGESWYWNSDDTTKTTIPAGTLGTLTYDYALEQIAMQRAAEIAVSFSHTRPNGNSCFSCMYNGVKSYGENIASGYSSTKSVFVGWREDNCNYSGQGHRRNMLETQWKAVGIACFVYNGYKYWVQEFSQSISSMSDPGANNSATNVDVEVKGIADPSTVEFTQHPKSVTAKPGDTVTFTAKAKGSEDYQWVFRLPDDTDGYYRYYNYDWAQKDTYSVSVTEDMDGWVFACAIPDNVNGWIFSNEAVLTVVTKPVITIQPKNVSVTEGTSAKFTVTASGGSLKYQWQWSADSGKTWTNSTSATTGYNKETLQVTATAARNGYKYRCKVTNAAGTVTSNAVTLTVSSKPTITTQPSNKTVSAGSTAKFTVTATGATSYQWQWSADNGSTWTNSTSATTGYNKDTLQVTATAARNGYKYRCKVSNSAGTTTSNAATLMVSSKPTITTQPSNKTVAVGSTATFKVVASNATGYQWQWSADNGATWSNSSSATTGYNTATLQVTATAARNGYKYRCKVSNSAGTVTSSAATLTVDLRPTITTQPSNKTVSAGSTAIFKVVASNATSYQWQWSADNGATWTNSTSATTGYNTATLQVTATAARNGYKYRCKVSNSAGTVTTSAAKLTVN